MTQVTPRDIAPSSQAGLASIQKAPVALVSTDPNHEHVWLPIQTERTSTGPNCYTEHRTYRCLCGQEVK